MFYTRQALLKAIHVYHMEYLLKTVPCFTHGNFYTFSQDLHDQKLAAKYGDQNLTF